VNDLFDNAQWLVGAIARGLDTQGGEGVKVVLERLSTQVVTRSALHFPEPAQLPVLRYFAQSIAETMMLDAELAAALAAVAESLQWRQSPSYNDALLGEGFLDNYGWCQIIGPHGFFPGDDFLLGLIMLGPLRHYSDHYHPAPELYWPLTGPSDWKRDTAAFETKSAGVTIWHDPNVVHATKTGNHPLLAIWCWTENTTTPAKLVAA